jgi:hypothetical protein
VTLAVAVVVLVMVGLAKGFFLNLVATCAPDEGHATANFSFGRSRNFNSSTKARWRRHKFDHSGKRGKV